MSCGVITLLEFASAILESRSNLAPPDAVGNGLEIPYLCRRFPIPRRAVTATLPTSRDSSAAASNNLQMHHAGPTGILTPGVISPCFCSRLE